MTAFRGSAENVQLEHSVAGNLATQLCLRIVARHHYADNAPELRDVYLIAASECGARECLFWHVGCPLSALPKLLAIAATLRAVPEYDPPGNCEPGWTFAAPEAAPKEASPTKGKADSALTFD